MNVEVAHEGDPSSAGGPLVTYRIQCYRHEVFVEEAVRSVLAQTYRPLEVLITDDASPDRTFEVARATAFAYRGPHRVILYRGEQNEDILGHWNDALPLMRGEFFLSLAGDDVAEPEQVDRLVGAWRGGGVSGAWSNYRVIDQHGRDCGAGLPDGHPYTLDLCDYADGRFLDFPYAGAVGYTREVIDRFGQVPRELGARGLEHHIGFRAAVLGPKRRIDQALVRKRNHPNRATAGHNRRDRDLDPMIVHERQIRVRLQVLLGCRGVISNQDGTARDPEHAGVARALTAQIATEARRLLACETYRETARRLAERGETSPPHSGWKHPPNGISLVRELPEYRCNLIAGECRYFAAPWSLGEIEPCALRNHAFSEVISAWSEEEVLRQLEQTTRAV